MGLVWSEREIDVLKEVETKDFVILEGVRERWREKDREMGRLLVILVFNVFQVQELMFLDFEGLGCIFFLDFMIFFYIFIVSFI